MRAVFPGGKLPPKLADHPVVYVSWDDARAYAADRIAAFKVPRYWEQLASLPRTPTARVAKHQLPADHSPAEYDADPQDQASPRKGDQ